MSDNQPTPPAQKPIATAPGFALTQEPLARKPAFDGAATESLALRATVGMLNDPKLLGPEISAKERAANLAVILGAGQAIPTGSEVLLPVQQQRQQQPQQQLGSVILPPVPQNFEEPFVAAKKVPGSGQPSFPQPKERAPEKIFFTGRLAVGKDYTASAAGYPIIGFADPIYALAEIFFRTTVNATTGKDSPGMREFLQTCGQWGRGEVSAQYPYTPTRAIFGVMIRSLAASGALPANVDWEKFGHAEFWIDSLLARAESAKRLAVTNCRFENEFTRLKAAGWTHYHVICHPATWAARLAAKRLTPESPAVKDLSERLAGALDAQIMQLLSKGGQGAKLRCIWNDEVPPPSPRLYTLNEFLSTAAATNY